MHYEITFLQATHISDWFDIYVNGIIVGFVTIYNIYWNDFPTKNELIKTYYKNIKRLKYDRKKIEFLNKKHKNRIRREVKCKAIWQKQFSYSGAFIYLKNYSKTYNELYLK